MRRTCATRAIAPKACLQHDVFGSIADAWEAEKPTLNLLHRLLDDTPINLPDVTPPTALSLSKEPAANVARL